jgi:hypothetical protein
MLVDLTLVYQQALWIIPAFFSASADVYIVGGTVTAITINGSATGLTTGMVRVPAGGKINITYSAPPTWKWFIN